MLSERKGGQNRLTTPGALVYVTFLKIGVQMQHSYKGNNSCLISVYMSRSCCKIQEIDVQEHNKMQSLLAAQ